MWRTRRYTLQFLLYRLQRCILWKLQTRAWWWRPQSSPSKFFFFVVNGGYFFFFGHDEENADDLAKDWLKHFDSPICLAYITAKIGAMFTLWSKPITIFHLWWGSSCLLKRRFPMFPAEKMISKDSKANDSSGFRGYLSLQCHAGNHYSLSLFIRYYSWHCSLRILPI